MPFLVYRVHVCTAGQKLLRCFGVTKIGSQDQGGVARAGFGLQVCLVECGWENGFGFVAEPILRAFTHKDGCEEMDS